MKIALPKPLPFLGNGGHSQGCTTRGAIPEMLNGRVSRGWEGIYFTKVIKPLIRQTST